MWYCKACGTFEIIPRKLAKESKYTIYEVLTYIINDILTDSQLSIKLADGVSIREFLTTKHK